MALKDLITSEKVLKVEHPVFEGFEVELKYISREKLRKFMEKSKVSTFNRQTGEMEEEVDNDLFVEMYTKAMFVGWKGLKYEYLLELLPIDLDKAANLEEELEFSMDDAITLMKNSPEFDNWISKVVGKVKNFNKSS